MNAILLAKASVARLEKPHDVYCDIRALPRQPSQKQMPLKLRGVCLTFDVGRQTSRRRYIAPMIRPITENTTTL